MSLEINNVVIGGNLARDVELKDTPGGRKVCQLVLANNNTFISNGEKRKETSFLEVDVWGVNAENCSRYLSKGSPVIVLGRIKQQRWETETGERRSRLKVVATNVQFLPGGSREKGQADDIDAASNHESEFDSPHSS